MEIDELNFGEFLAARLRDKGISLKRLSEITGIAPIHLENLLRGNFGDVPSTPYFRGYLIRIGKALDFDGEAWWEKFKEENSIKNSGPSDVLPRNRFVKKEFPKSLWAAGVAAVLLLVYFAFTLSHIIGKPTLTITFPSENPFVTSSITMTIRGVVQNADALYLLTENASSSEEIIISPNGSWQKEVTLGNSPNLPNSFKIGARKFLGGETDVTIQIIRESPAPTGSSTTSSAAFPTIHYTPGTPATGTYFD